MFAWLGRETRYLACLVLVAAAAANGCSNRSGSGDGGGIVSVGDAAALGRDAGDGPSDRGSAAGDDTQKDSAADAKSDTMVGDAARADVPTGDAGHADVPRSDGRLGDGVLADGTSAEAGPEVCPWGDQQVHQTSYGLATTLRICLASSSPSKLRYHVTIPSTPAAGGYVVVSFRKVSQYIEIGVGVVPDQTSYPLDDSWSAGNLGLDFDAWFAAAAGAGFFIDVSNAWSDFATISQDFEMSATLVPVDDPYEPNDSQKTAATISVGTPITASAFAGCPSSSDMTLIKSDYYKVTLPAGVPTITVTGASPTFALDVTFDDPKSQSFTFAAYGATGSNGSVSISPSGPVAAGDYYVFVEADYTYRGYGRGTTPPSYLIQSYTLLVTSEPLHDAAPPEVGSDGPKRDVSRDDASQAEETGGAGDGWISVSAGTFYACGVRGNGTVACWGKNSAGQATPPDGTFVSVSASYTHTCGLRTDGSVACWGDNTYGQSSPPSDTFVSVDTGERESCGVKTDGTAACWGYNDFGESTPLDGTFTSTSSGGDSTCGLRPDGTAACWGYTGYLETNPPGGTFVSLSVGYGHACGVRPDGSLPCWGISGSGGYSPPAGVYVAVADGSTHTCGIMDSGVVACWGHNDAGDVLPPSGTFVAISSGYYLSCGIRSDGTIACWGDNGYGQATPPTQ